MCCDGLAVLFADDRRRNTAFPRLVGLPLDGAFQLKLYVLVGWLVWWEITVKDDIFERVLLNLPCHWFGIFLRYQPF